MNPNVFHQSKITDLEQPLKMSALNKIHYVKQKAIVKAFSEFQIPNENFEFYVYNFNNNFEGLIGNDILRKFKSHINYSNNTLIINNKSLPLYYDNNKKVVLNLKPGDHSYEIPVNIDKGNILIKNLSYNNDDISLNEGLYDCKDGKTVININNKSKNNIKINLCDHMNIDEIKEIHQINKVPFNTINNENIDITEIKNKLGLSHLNLEEEKELNKILIGFKEIFSDNEKLSFTHEIKHSIITKDDIPIKSKIYRYPYIYKDEIQKQILEMLKSGVITPSNSPYNSPVWVVPKKADALGINKFRLVIDYRKLNEKTIDDNYPIPNITEILDKLGKSNYFSILDLKSGFHQIEVDEKDQQKTAFSVDNGHYEFKRMPFGLKNAPSTFQRLVDNILRENVSKRECMVYMDDIIVFSNGLEEHSKNLKSVLVKLKNARLKV